MIAFTTPESVLRALAKERGIRVSSCQHLDPHVCESKITRGWHVVESVAGDLFFAKCSWVNESGHRVRLIANRSFIRAEIVAKLDAGVCSFGRRDRIMQSSEAYIPPNTGPDVPVFSQNGIRSGRQLELAAHLALKTIFDHAGANASVHFYKNAVLVYLSPESPAQVKNILDEMRTLVTEFREEKSVH